jgi:carbamoyl-phosphate synthase large subunit
VPFVAKTIGRPDRQDRGAHHGRREPRRAFGHYGTKPDCRSSHIAVKEAVFPFARFPGVDILLGPEMKSTGEVMGLDRDFALAFAKSQLGAGIDLPRAGTLFVSVRDEDKAKMLPVVKRLADLGFKVLATGGTAALS